MYVSCPSCKAVYQIQAEHLHAARGQVRCGACRNTFSAFEAVFDDPAQALAYADLAGMPPVNGLFAAALPLVAAAACVGIVIGVVTLTGIGTRLPVTILRPGINDNTLNPACLEGNLATEMFRWMMQHLDGAAWALVDEGSNIEVTVTLSNASSEAITVTIATADGTATDGNDYTGGAYTVSFPAGVTVATFDIPTGDDLFDEAVELVRSMDKASISLLQRHLRIGYTRAARLIDLMEEHGVIGPHEGGSKPREVLES